jgi:outer membrane protein assembly factor BamB
MFDPRERSQPITFLACLFVGCMLLCGLASAAPSITVSKKSGPPTSKILVSGRGFQPNVGVDIYFDTKDETLVVTNGKGEFDKAEIHAPRSARPGKHWVTALERNNDKGAQEPFLVQTNWSQFHFDADGTRLNPYENVLNVGTVGSIDLKWSHREGRIDSAAAIVEGVIYFGSDDWNVYALNASTGAKLWSYPTDQPVESSPTIVDGVVYIGSADGKVYALNASTGAKLWSYLTGNAVFSYPTVANGVVYVGSDDYNLYALNAKSGSKLWSYSTGLYVRSSPTATNGVVYVGSWDDSVYALNAKTGAKLWSYPTGSFVESPIVRDGVVYIGSDKVYALNASTGALLWSYDTGSGLGSSPAVANGMVYIGAAYPNNNVYAVNANTGALEWRYNTGGSVVSSPAVANGVVYVGSNDGNIYALDATRGTELWRYPTDGGVYSSPSVANGVVYVSTYGNTYGTIYAFGLAHGDRAKQEKAIKRPDSKTLRPDFALVVSKPVATTSGAER